MNKNLRLMVISPVKNEQETIEILLESMVNQTRFPDYWLIIDNGSTDRTVEIVVPYLDKYPAIKLLEYKSTTARSTGSNVVNVFNYGLEYAEQHGYNWQVVAKIDGDISFDDKDYVERIMSEFEKSNTLGIASGCTYYLENGKKTIENKYEWHTQGQTKFYGKQCLFDMNGLRPMKGWDGFDDILARNLGYNTRMYTDLMVRHYFKTQTRTAEGGVMKGVEREALGYRNRGYPLWMYLFKSIKLMKQKPYVIHGLYFLYYGIKLMIFQKSFITPDEKKMVHKFLLDRALGKIKTG